MSDTDGVDGSGELNVYITAEDIQHLRSHGTSVVTKQAGPLRVNIKCHDRIYFTPVVDGEQTGEQL